MNWYRVFALVERHLTITTREFHRFIDLVYWPFLDIVLWGLTGLWLQSGASSSNATYMLLVSIIFWQLCNRAELEVITSLVDELWAHNFFNLFSSPLTITEWIVTVMILGIIKSLFTLFFGFTLIWLLYGVGITQWATSFIPFVFFLMINGWAIGFFMSAFILTWGHRIQSFAWAMDWTLAVFSAVYYPIESLPFWAQKVSYLLPMTYFFESLRHLIATGELSFELLTQGALMSVLYIVLSIIIFITAFNRSKIDGLAQLEAK